MINLLHGDCLELMGNLPDKSVDMILCDLPYGVTECKWDIVIPFEPLWEQYKRIIKSGGAIVLFSQAPFYVDLINSNRKMFRYEWIYEKALATGFLNANRMPLKSHENILVFYDKLPTYNPQFTKAEPYKKHRRNDFSAVYNKHSRKETVHNTGKRYPTDIIKFCNANQRQKKHPTEKPTDLLEYLLKTYTNEGETVLDNCMGSGSTGVACINTNRNFIGIELNKDFYETAKKRINEALEKILRGE